ERGAGPTRCDRRRVRRAVAHRPFAPGDEPFGSASASVTLEGEHEAPGRGTVVPGAESVDPEPFEVDPGSIAVVTEPGSSRIGSISHAIRADARSIDADARSID